MSDQDQRERMMEAKEIAEFYVGTKPTNGMEEDLFKVCDAYLDLLESNRWIQEPPKVAGWYWHKWDGLEAKIVHVRKMSDTWFRPSDSALDDAWHPDSKKNHWWAGPLPLPDNREG